MHQRCAGHVAKIVPIDGDRAARHVRRPVEQVDQRAFAGARGPYQGEKREGEEEKQT